MGKWLLILGGLLIWAAHFFLLYAFASIFPGTQLARVLTVGATLATLVVNAGIIFTLFTAGVREDELERWARAVGLGGALLSFVAVLWQGLPGLI